MIYMYIHILYSFYSIVVQYINGIRRMVATAGARLVQPHAEGAFGGQHQEDEGRRVKQTSRQVTGKHRNTIGKP